MSKLLTNIAEGKNLRIFGDRVFIPVEDVAEVIKEALLRGIIDNTTSDVGKGVGKRLIGLAILLKEIGNRPVNIFIKHPDRARLSTVWWMF
jgi:hypothetical protein